jgi:hypothetical protein
MVSRFWFASMGSLRATARRRSSLLLQSFQEFRIDPNCFHLSGLKLNRSYVEWFQEIEESNKISGYLNVVNENLMVPKEDRTVLGFVDKDAVGQETQATGYALPGRSSMRVRASKISLTGMNSSTPAELLSLILRTLLSGLAHLGLPKRL